MVVDESESKSENSMGWFEPKRVELAWEEEMTPRPRKSVSMNEGVVLWAFFCHRQQAVLDLIQYRAIQR